MANADGLAVALSPKNTLLAFVLIYCGQSGVKKLTPGNGNADHRNQLQKQLALIFVMLKSPTAMFEHF